MKYLLICLLLTSCSSAKEYRVGDCFISSPPKSYKIDEIGKYSVFVHDIYNNHYVVPYEQLTDTTQVDCFGDFK